LRPAGLTAAPVPGIAGGAAEAAASKAIEMSVLMDGARFGAIGIRSKQPAGQTLKKIAIHCF
jgi:hypothetical protein